MPLYRIITRPTCKSCGSTKPQGGSPHQADPQPHCSLHDCGPHHVSCRQHQHTMQTTKFNGQTDRNQHTTIHGKHLQTQPPDTVDRTTTTTSATDARHNSIRTNTGIPYGEQDAPEAEGKRSQRVRNTIGQKEKTYNSGTRRRRHGRRYFRNKLRGQTV